MKAIQTVMTTTRVDRHNDRMTIEALESMRDHIQSAYLPFIYNHDPRCPPLGRVISAEIVPLDDGEHALQADVELFEAGPIPPLVGDKSIAERSETGDGFVLSVDRTFDLPEFEEPVKAITDLFGTQPRYEVKKALEPIAVLGITAGLLVAGKFAGAFFAKLGTDAAEALSAKLKAIFAQKPPEQERLLKFEFEFEDGGRRCQADVILTGPDAGEIDQFFVEGINELDKVLPKCLGQVDGLVRYVFTYTRDGLKLEFAVRRDARPMFPVTAAPKTSSGPPG